VVLLGTLTSVSAAAAPALAPIRSPAPSSQPAGGSTPSSSTSYSLTPKQFGLTISPTRLVVGPSEIGTTQEVTVINRGQAPLQVRADKRNFTSSRSGSLSYAKNAAYGAATWVTVRPASFVLAPGAAQVVTARIDKPSAAEPGDHQVAIVFLIPTSQGKGNIKINRGIAAPMYITVPGAVDSSMSLTGLRAARFAMRGPVAITATMRNLGTVHRDFRAPSPLTIEAGGGTAAFPDFTVPRGATRDIVASWDPPLACICHPSVSFVNTGQAVQTQTIRVIIFPWHLLGIAVGSFLALLLLIRLARRHYRAQVSKAAALQRLGSGGDA
jgi:hypothetical protein